MAKYVRAKAHKEGIMFMQALDIVEHSENGIGTFMPKLRNSSHRPSWEVRDHIRSKRLSKRLSHTPDVDKPDTSEFDATEETTPSEVLVAPRRRTDMFLPILKIARPAKGKGVARDFELVRNVRNVIALPEDRENAVLGNDDDWERIYDEQEVDGRKSYSSVLRGNDRAR
ncbi:hypothetical protein BDN70DRAFT_873961 [Pholiota conissans]|uniref:Uncharacterized protein n=1 Tax=Pholiota conissans TaxID=109636 RepID=A0A9P5ZAR1_9AGAR|nr:hypothetical protein BDN70DRAFT_873961 [Pholiota conissans]